MEKSRTNKWVQIGSLALGIALLPPLWAVLAPLLGVRPGAVALICAGVYVAAGNQRQKALPIITGFLLGDLWAVLSLWLMAILNFNPQVELYLVLFVFGGMAVVGGENLPRYIYTPAWLCGWAIGLTVMGNLAVTKLGSLPFEMGIAMVVGVIYVGIGVASFQQWLIEKIAKH